MPDASGPPAVATLPRRHRSWVSPLLRRVLLVNVVPLALLFATLLYLDQYQDGLLEAEVSALREQARIYAGALGESAVRVTDPNNPSWCRNWRGRCCTGLPTRRRTPAPSFMGRMAA